VEHELAAQGIGHFPTLLPTQKDAFVLLYSRHGQPGRLLDLVRQLTETSASTNSQILTLSAMLGPLRAQAEEDAASA
jgi:hypothetical protein